MFMTLSAYTNFGDADKDIIISKWLHICHNFYIGTKFDSIFFFSFWIFQLRNIQSLH